MSTECMGKSNLSNIAFKNLNNHKLNKSQLKNRSFNLTSEMNTMKKYDIAGDQKYFYPYHQRNEFFQSFDSRKISNQQPRNNRFHVSNLKGRRKRGRPGASNLSLNPGRRKSTSQFLDQFQTIQDRFQTQNLDDFMRVYRSNDQKYRGAHKSLEFDALMSSVGLADPKGDFKLDSVKNTLGAPDPKSSFFRTRDNHFVRKDSNKFFMDERLRKRDKEILSVNKLHKIILRENKFYEDKENKFKLGQKMMNQRRRQKLNQSKRKALA